MAQTQYHAYESPDTTLLLNNKLKGIIQQGVYSGFNVIRSSTPAAGTLALSIRHDIDPDMDPVDSGVNGGVVADGGGVARRWSSAGQNFLTTVTDGDILVVADATNTANNGEYIITNVVSNTTLDIAVPQTAGGAFPSGIWLGNNLTYTIRKAKGYIRTPDGVIISEDACQDAAIGGWALTNIANGAADPRIDLVVIRYAYVLAPAVGTYMVLNGVAAPNPVPPAITDNDIILAQIWMPAGAGAVVQENIYSVEKMELYGMAESQKLDDRNKLLKPGVYDGYELYQGTAAANISLGKGTLLTPQYYKIRETSPLPDELTLNNAAAGRHRYAWSICLHRWTNMDPVDNPTYMVVDRYTAGFPGAPAGGSEELLATTITPPTNADIYQCLAFLADKYSTSVAGSAVGATTAVGNYTFTDATGTFLSTVKEGDVLSITAGGYPGVPVYFTVMHVDSNIQITVDHQWVAGEGPLAGLTYQIFTMDYVTKLGYTHVINTGGVPGITSVEHYNTDRVLLPETIRVSDGLGESGKASDYSGPTGLLEAIHDFVETYKTLLKDTAYTTDTKAAYATLSLDGRFILTQNLHIPSCLKLVGEGAPAKIEFQDTTTYHAYLSGFLAEYDGANTLWAAAPVVGGATPTGYIPYTFTLRVGYQIGDNFLLQNLLPGDMVELYSPTAATKFSTGYLYSINGPWALTIHVPAGPAPVPGVDNDISMVIRKRKNGIINCHVSDLFVAYENQATIRDILVARLESQCNYQCRFENISIYYLGAPFAVASVRLSTLPAVVPAGDELHFYAITGANSSPYGGVGNVYSEIRQEMYGGATNNYLGYLETKCSYDSFDMLNTTHNATVMCYGESNRFERITARAPAAAAAVTLSACTRCYFEYIHLLEYTTTHVLTVDAGSSYNVFANIQGDMTLAAGAANNTIFYSSHAHTYTDSSGTGTNVNYYLDITTWNNDYLRTAFQDFILPPEANTGLVSNALTNPRGLYFDNASSLAGAERIRFTGLIPVTDDYAGDLNRHVQKRWMLPNRDPRIRFVGNWYYHPEQCCVKVQDGDSAYIEVTSVMTGLILHSKAPSTILMSTLVDNVGVGNIAPTGEANAVLDPGAVTGACSIIPETIIGSMTGLLQNIHTIRCTCTNAGADFILLTGIDILNNNPTQNVTDLAGSITSDRQLKSVSFATNNAFATIGAYGGRAWRKISNTTQARSWSVNNFEHITNPATTVAGAPAGFVIPFTNAANFSQGDMILINGTDLYTITLIAGNNVTVDIGPIAYVGGEPVIRYCQTYNSNNAAALDLDHLASAVYRRINFRDFSTSYRLLTTVTSAGPIVGNASSNNEFLVGSGISANPILGSGTGVTYDVLRLDALNSAILITFVGTGLSIMCGSIVAVDPHDVYIDGGDATGGGALAQLWGAATTPLYTDICSHLPYGTHTVRIVKTAAAAANTQIMDFIVWAPADISSTEQKTCEYFAPYQTPSIVSRVSTVPNDVVTLGMIRHSVGREWRFSNPAWALSTAVGTAYGHGGFSRSCAVAGHSAIFWYYGRQCVVWGTLGAAATFTIDGAGAYAFSTVLGPYVVNDPGTTGWHCVTITSSVANTIINAIDVATPCHYIIPESCCPNEYNVSCGNIRNVRNIAPNRDTFWPTNYTVGKTPKDKALVTDGAYGFSNTLAVAHAAATEVVLNAICHVNTSGKPVLVSISGSIVGLSAGPAHVVCSLIVDGVAAEIPITAYLSVAEHDMFGQTIIQDLEAGSHTIVISGTDTGGTGVRIEGLRMTARECS